MDTFSDIDGIVYTARDKKSVQLFNTLVDCYMGYKPETGDKLKALMAHDPGMPMAMCMKGYFGKMMGNARQSGKARIMLENLQEHIATIEITSRERWHIEALEAWCDGQLDRAEGLWEQILMHCPLDCVALKLAHFNHFYSGDGRRVRDSMARVLPHWSDNHHRYGYVLGMYAFGLEESGDYRKAEDYGRQAVEFNPADAWSVHAVAHVLEMEERHEEGIAWLKDLEPHWSTVNNFRFHLYWHWCLYYLERREFDTVLEIYDAQLASDLEAEFYLDACNTASMLWRLEMFGVDIGNRWKDLAHTALGHLQDRDLVFVSLHYLMPLVSIGDEVAATELVTNMRDWACTGDTQGEVISRAGMVLAESLWDTRRGNYARASEQLKKIRYEIDCIGGSIAQRDLFVMAMLDATSKAGLEQETASLVAERASLRPGSGWLLQ